MTQTDNQKSAFIREGALVLYFDLAEKPVIARFDLDTLAQASFEVSSKDAEGFYTIVLNDFSGAGQPVAQFASKADAHNALYAILQALLSHKEKDVSSCASRCGCGCRGFFKGLLRTLLHLIVLALLTYGSLYLYFMYVAPSPQNGAPVAMKNVPGLSGQQTNTNEQKPAQSSIPSGEAISAEDYLSTLTGTPTTEQSPQQ